MLLSLDTTCFNPCCIFCPIQCPLGPATILGLATRNSGFLDDQYINSTLGLATYIGFGDLNRVDENWSLNPAGTVLGLEVQWRKGDLID